MHAWEAIQKSVDYMEDHLADPLSIEYLASLAGLSPFYFQRLFRRLVGKPVMEYMKLRRLAWATAVLGDKQNRILDVALDAGFSSHKSFTRAFKETYGITPAQFRSNPVRLTQYLKPVLLLHYTLIDEGVPLITDSMYLEISRKTLLSPRTFKGLRALASIPQHTPAGQATGVNVPGQLWDAFHLDKDQIPDLMPDGMELGACFMGEDLPEGYFTYFAGVEVTSNAQNADDAEESVFTTWVLPATSYVVCTFEAETYEALVEDALDKALQYLFGTWLPSHQLMTEPFSAELYTSRTPQNASMELWVVPLPAEH